MRMHLHNTVTKMLHSRTLGTNGYTSQSNEILIKRRKKYLLHIAQHKAKWKSDPS